MSSWRAQLAALGVVAALSLGACGPASPTLTVDGARLDPLTASARLDTSTSVTVVLLTLDHAGPANVSDAGITYEFRVELAGAPQSGTTLEVDGASMLDAAPGGGLYARVFTAGARNDARVFGVSVTAQCFCGGVAHAEQTVSGHIDVVQSSSSGLVLEVDLVVDGVIPGPDVHERLALQGRFTAPTHTR